MATVNNWLQGFLSADHRGLAKPDERPLFAYQTSKEEFDELGELLGRCLDTRFGSPRFVTNTGRLFVLYGAEWWRRNFSGGSWKWELITDSLGWQDVEQRHLVGLVAEGLGYWKRDIVRTAVGNAYLTTIVLEGGIPLLLLQHQGASFTRYLKAVIGEHAKWVGAGMSAYAHAESCQRVLNAKSLRKEQVFRLAATIVEVIYDLSTDLQSKTEPFKELSQKDPHWYRRLPMAVDDDAAKTLVDALLKEAQRKRSSRYEKFVINRFLTLVDGIWVQRAKLEVPDTIPSQVISEQLEVKHDSLPSRMELVARTSRFTMKVASLMRVQREQDEFAVSFYRSNSMSFDLPFDEEITCTLQSAGQSLGDYRADGADRIDIDLPLLFVPDDALDWRLMGAGSLSTRVENGRLLAPASSSVEGTIEPVEDDHTFRSEVLGAMQVFDVSGEVLVRLDDGFLCRLRLGASRDTNTQYSLRGHRLYALEQRGVPIFAGLPTIAAPQGSPKPEAVLWRSELAGSSWIDSREKPPLGLVRIRALIDEECVFAASLIVLPPDFRFLMNNEEGFGEGNILMRGLEGAVVNCADANEIQTELETINNVTVIYCRSQGAGGGRFPVGLRWDDGLQCTIAMPFPGEGARFVNVETGEMCHRRVSINELINVSAQVVSWHQQQGFRLFAQLRAADVDTSISRSSMYFQRTISRFSDNLAEVSLVDLYGPIKELFSYSADLDATVRVEISSGTTQALLDVVQFDGELRFNPAERTVTYEAELELPVENPVLKYLPFDIEQDAAELEIDGDLEFMTWRLDASDDLAGMVIVEGQLGRLVRPCVVYSLEETAPTDYHSYVEVSEEDSEAEETIAEKPLVPLPAVWKLPSANARRREFEAIFERLADVPDSEDWQLLVQYVQRYRDAHPDCLDIHEALIDSPRALVGLICRSQPEIADLLIEWGEYLPVRFWMVPANVWRDEVTAYLGYLSQFDDTVVDLEKAKLIGIFKKIRDLQPNTLLVMNRLLDQLDDPQDFTDIELKFKAFDEKPAPYQAAIQSEVASSLFGRPEDERWPSGLTRELWNNIDKNPLWLEPGSGFRKAFIDAPVFSAFCVAKGIYLSRGHRAHVAAIRNFDSQAFDQIYVSFLVVFLKFVK